MRALGCYMGHRGDAGTLPVIPPGDQSRLETVGDCKGFQGSHVSCP